MTDADDEGLLESLRLAANPDCWWAADRIQKLRRDRDEAKEWSRLRAMDIVELGQLAGRTLEAEAALAEALNIMDDVRGICTFDVTMEGAKYTGTNASACIRAYKAACAFLAKHGARSDG